MVNDIVSDTIARIKNAHQRNKKTVDCLYSKFNCSVLDVLKNEGYIQGYEIQDVRTGIKKIVVDLKYYAGKPVITILKRVSTPGCRVYTQSTDLKPFRNGLGVTIVSTSKGVLSSNDARHYNLGGEVICEVF